MRHPQLTAGLQGFVLVLLVSVFVGCNAAPPTTQTGFLSDYSRLEPVDKREARYISQALGGYDTFMVDAVRIEEIKDPPVLDDRQRVEVAAYLRARLIGVLENSGYAVTDEAGPGVGRVRIAVTRIKRSTWWLNLHPGSKASGVGTGGAAMEAEILDAQTGQQLAAAVISGAGNQFELDTFSKLDDVKDVIDGWAKKAEQRIAAYHDRTAGGDPPG